MTKNEFITAINEIAYFRSNSDAKYQDAAFEKIRFVMNSTGLDFRTITALADMVNGKIILPDGMLAKVTDPAFYSVDTCCELVKMGKDMERFIPVSFYQDPAFIRKANIHAIPDEFAKGDRALSSFVVLPEIRSIGQQAFAGCDHMIVFIYKDRGRSVLREIGREAFRGCSNLSLASLPSSIRTIGKGAYNDCEKLQYIRVFQEDGSSTTYYLNKIGEGLKVYAKEKARGALPGMDAVFQGAD